jgi:hypothetical protein
MGRMGIVRLFSSPILFGGTHSFCFPLFYIQLICLRISDSFAAPRANQKKTEIFLQTTHSIDVISLDFTQDASRIKYRKPGSKAASGIFVFDGVSSVCQPSTGGWQNHRRFRASRRNTIKNAS